MSNSVSLHSDKFYLSYTGFHFKRSYRGHLHCWVFLFYESISFGILNYLDKKMYGVS